MRHMRVIVTQYGGPNVITITEEDIPMPKAGEVRVKVLAAENPAGSCARRRRAGRARP